MGGIGNFFSSVVQSVGDAVQDVGGFVGDVINSAMENPVETIAMVVAAYYLGPAVFAEEGAAYAGATMAEQTAINTALGGGAGMGAGAGVGAGAGLAAADAGMGAYELGGVSSNIGGSLINPATGLVATGATDAATKTALSSFANAVGAPTELVQWLKNPLVNNSVSSLIKSGLSGRSLEDSIKNVLTSAAGAEMGDLASSVAPADIAKLSGALANYTTQSVIKGQAPSISDFAVDMVTGKGTGYLKELMGTDLPSPLTDAAAATARFGANAFLKGQTPDFTKFAENYATSAAVNTGMGVVDAAVDSAGNTVIKYVNGSSTTLDPSGKVVDQSAASWQTMDPATADAASQNSYLTQLADQAKQDSIQALVAKADAGEALTQAELDTVYKQYGVTPGAVMSGTSLGSFAKSLFNRATSGPGATGAGATRGLGALPNAQQNVGTSSQVPTTSSPDAAAPLTATAPAFDLEQLPYGGEQIKVKYPWDDPLPTTTTTPAATQTASTMFGPQAPLSFYSPEYAEGGNVMAPDEMQYQEPMEQSAAPEGHDSPEGHNPEFFSEGGMMHHYVKGGGTGTSDSIPAMLATGEFVIPADVVSGLGDGDNDSGAKVLDEFLAVIRKHKRAADSRQLPPDSKGPLAYLASAQQKVSA